MGGVHGRTCCLLKGALLLVLVGFEDLSPGYDRRMVLVKFINETPTFWVSKKILVQ